MHGTHDLVAAPRYAAELASRLSSKVVMVDGAHFIPRECSDNVARALISVVLNGSYQVYLNHDHHGATEVLPMIISSADADADLSLVRDSKDRKRMMTSHGCFPCCG
jgi:hypothetical protein